MGEYKPFINLGPGDSIREELEFYGWEQRDLAEIMGMTEKHISQLVQNKVAVTYETACLLSKVFKQTPQFWLNLDANFRQRLQESAKVKETEAKALLYRYMPIRELRPLLDLPRKTDELVAAIKRFWGIGELDFGFLEKQAACFSKSDAHKGFNPFYALTWLQLSRNSLTAKLPSAKFNRARLETLARRLPEFTLNEPRNTRETNSANSFHHEEHEAHEGRLGKANPHLRGLRALRGERSNHRAVPSVDNGVVRFIQELGQCGVVFRQIDHFQQTYIDGASFFEGGRPVIVYTARHDRVDNFWFTMAHELGHVLLHEDNQGQVFIDSLDHLDLTNRREKEADDFAATLLKNAEILAAFKGVLRPSSARVQAVAERLGLHPGVVAGCLQHHGKAAWSSFHEFKDEVRPLLGKVV